MYAVELFHTLRQKRIIGKLPNEIEDLVIDREVYSLVLYLFALKAIRSMVIIMHSKQLIMVQQSL